MAKLYVITFVRRVQAERTGFRLSSKVWTRLYLWLLVFRVFLIPRYRGRYRESSACWGPGPAPRAAEPQQLLEREPPGGRGSERVLHTDAGEAGPGLQWGTAQFTREWNLPKTDGGKLPSAGLKSVTGFVGNQGVS